MPSELVKIKNKPKSLPLLPIGAGNSRENEMGKAVSRWELVFEVQLHVDWKMTTAVRNREGDIGKLLRRSWDRFQDMHNLITRPLVKREKDLMRLKLGDYDPEVRERIIENTKGAVIGVRWTKKNQIIKIKPDRRDPKEEPYDWRVPGRINQKIYVYRYKPDKYFEDLGFHGGSEMFVLPFQLFFKRDEIYEFRRTLKQKSGKKPGAVKMCFFCHDLFVSRKSQKEPYVCSKHRCRKAKVRLKSVKN
jgi:hypothetical protein